MPGADGYRPVLPLLRLGLGLGVVFTAIAGFALFVLSHDTDRFFAWTIAVPMTAAFIGIFYLMAMAVALLSVRRPEWALVRAGVPGVVVFLWATAVATALHLDLFHLGEGSVTGQVAAWVWVAIYIVDPILLTAAFVQQVRQPGDDRPRTERLPTWYRAALTTTGSAVGGLGVLMYLAPTWVGGWWLWSLTALTGRMIGAWLIGGGLVLLAMAWEDDRDRIRPVALALVVFGTFELVALARFSDDLTGTAAGWIFGLSAVVTLALGALGLKRRDSASGRGKSALATA